MKIFLAGENYKEKIIRKFADEAIFSGGESRHWLQTPLIEEQNNEIISCRRILQEHGQRSQADCMGGGFPDEVNNENLFSKSTYNTEIPRRATNGDYPIRGGYD